VVVDVLFGKSRIYIVVQNRLWTEQWVDTFHHIYVNNALTKYKKSFATMTSVIITDGRSSR
jgi:hypothetical protein